MLAARGDINRNRMTFNNKSCWRRQWYGLLAMLERLAPPTKNKSYHHVFYHQARQVTKLDALLMKDDTLIITIYTLTT